MFGFLPVRIGNHFWPWTPYHGNRICWEIRFTDDPSPRTPTSLFGIIWIPDLIPERAGEKIMIPVLPLAITVPKFSY